MPDAHRLKRWQTAVGDGGLDQPVLEAVRAALDDDLDTPGALRALDEAADAVGGGCGSRLDRRGRHPS